MTYEQLTRINNEIRMRKEILTRETCMTNDAKTDVIEGRKSPCFCTKYKFPRFTEK